MSRRKPAERRPLRTEAEVLAQTFEACALFGLDVKRQNVGAAANPGGQMVRFNERGDADISGMLPDGRRIDIECKAEGFDPRRLRGAKRAHWDRQFARLKRTNDQGGVGLWTDSPEQLPRVFARLLEGWRVEFDGDGIPWLTDESREKNHG